MDAFEVLAAPTRRRIIAALRGKERSVNELVEALDERQPSVSKHLRVLREGGFVACREAAQQRLYALRPERFAELDAWLRPYVRLWTRHLDALERHLDQEEHHEAKRLPGRPPAARRPRGAR